MKMTITFFLKKCLSGFKRVGSEKFDNEKRNLIGFRVGFGKLYRVSYRVSGLYAPY